MIMRKFIHKINEQEYKCVAKIHSWIYGKGVDVHILDEAENIKKYLKFRCIPDLKDFEYYNNMDDSKLIDVIIERVQSGKIDKEFQSELSANFVINDTQIKGAQDGSLDLPDWYKELG